MRATLHEERWICELDFTRKSPVLVSQCHKYGLQWASGEQCCGNQNTSILPLWISCQYSVKVTLTTLLYQDDSCILCRMESNSEKNRIHMSEEAAKLVQEQDVNLQVEKRIPQIHVKGLGKMSTYWLMRPESDAPEYVSMEFYEQVIFFRGGFKGTVHIDNAPPHIIIENDFLPDNTHTERNCDVGAETEDGIVDIQEIQCLDVDAVACGNQSFI